MDLCAAGIVPLWICARRDCTLVSWTTAHKIWRPLFRAVHLSVSSARGLGNNRSVLGRVYMHTHTHVIHTHTRAHPRTRRPHTCTYTYTHTDIVYNHWRVPLIMRLCIRRYVFVHLCAPAEVTDHCLLRSARSLPLAFQRRPHMCWSLR